MGIPVSRDRVFEILKEKSSSSGIVVPLTRSPENALVPEHCLGVEFARIGSRGAFDNPKRFFAGRLFTVSPLESFLLIVGNN